GCGNAVKLVVPNRPKHPGAPEPVVGHPAIPQDADRAACLGLDHDALKGSKTASLFEQRQAGARAVERKTDITRKTRRTWHRPFTIISQRPKQRSASAFFSRRRW